MLALLVYTGCDCNNDMYRALGEGNFLKWKWLDLTPFKTICWLSVREKSSCKLRHTKLGAVAVERAFFATYTSTMWRREIAQRFATDSMLLEFEERFRSDRKSAVLRELDLQVRRRRVRSAHRAR